MLTLIPQTTPAQEWLKRLGVDGRLSFATEDSLRLAVTMCIAGLKPADFRISVLPKI